MSAAPPLSIVVPCFNEGRRIASSLATLDAWFDDRAEVLVMDDGSSDDSAALAEAHAERHPRCRVYRLPHRGKGAALRTAIPLVAGDRIVFVDADLAFDRESVQRVIDALDEAEMAIGNRRHRGSRYAVPVHLFGFLYSRHVMGLAFNGFVRALTRLPHKDTQCGLKAFRRPCLERLAPRLTIDGFALDVEILMAAAAAGLQPAQVPVHVRYESARSGVRIVSSGWSMARDILRLAARRDWRT